MGNGSVEILKLILSTFGDYQQEIIFANPGFPKIIEISISEGLKPVEIPIIWNENSDNWGTSDLDSILAHINERTRIIYIINPEIPTGRFITKERFSKFIKKVPSNVLIIVDEAYIDYTLKQFVNTFIGSEYINNFSNVIVVRSFSKAYGLAGLRVGYAFSNENVINALKRRSMSFTLNTVSQMGAKYVLIDEKHLEKTQKYIHEQKEYLEKSFIKYGIKMFHSYINIVMFKYANTDFFPFVNFLASKKISVWKYKYLARTFCYSIGREGENNTFIEIVAEYFEKGKN